MTYDIGTAVASLSRTPHVLHAWLSDLPVQWLDAPEAPGLWSPRDIACHMADLEHDGWIPRIMTIVDSGADTGLAAVDRERFRERYANIPLARVLQEFQAAREKNLGALRDLELDASALERVGRHPALGEVRLRHLLSAWTLHDLTHIAQIARAMAAQYRDEVGPWQQFLSVLNPGRGSGAEQAR